MNQGKVQYNKISLYINYEESPYYRKINSQQIIVRQFQLVNQLINLLFYADTLFKYTLGTTYSLILNWVSNHSIASIHNCTSYFYLQTFTLIILTQLFLFNLLSIKHYNNHYYHSGLYLIIPCVFVNNIYMKLNNISFKGVFHTLICLYISLFISTHVQAQQSQQKFPNFNQFVTKFNKNYSSQQYLERKEIYLQNIQIMQASNCRSCGANYFADWTLEQMNKLRTVKKSINRDKIGATSSHHDLKKGRLLIQNYPVTFDWRNFTNLTSVKHQGYCGASWAFSAAAFFQQDSILSGLANQSLNLSEQYLVTCNRQNQGCDSGYIQTSMDLVMDKGGIPLQSKYPYHPLLTQNLNMCFSTDLFKVPNSMRISHFDIVDPETIKKIILKKPVNIGICGADLIHYYPSSNQTSARTLKCKPSNRIIDHAVLLIGYTQTQWIIKNQWGEGWGLNGYAYISRKTSEDCCIGEQMYTSGNITQECTVLNCKTCVQNHTCYRCSQGFYVQHNQTTGVQTCMPCNQSNCLECYNYFGTCRQCIDGFALNAATGKCVNSTIAYCNLFSGTTCKQCHRGYKLSSIGTSCLANCALRNCIKCAQGPCSLCKSGYSLKNVSIDQIPTQKCVLNPCNVSNCTFCDDNGTCIQCYGAFVLANGTCNNNCNISGCISCTTTTTCSQCVQGKSWNTTKKACQAMSATPNCKNHNATKCTSCKSGYAFNTAKTLCNQVCQNSSCANCSKSDTGICFNCSNGYYLQTTTYEFYCVPYPCTLPNCTICTADGLTCLICLTNYYIWNSTAGRCEIQCKIANCYLCLPNDTKCNTCNPGYAVVYQTKLCRQSNISNCPMVYNYSDGSYDCQVCAPNYYMSDDYMECLIYCDDYYCQFCLQETLDVCISCFAGYSLQFKSGRLTCLYTDPQMIGCQLITENQTYCYQCTKYYRNENGVCILNTINCTSGCQYCTPTDSNYAYTCVCQPGLTFEYYSQVCLTSNPLGNNCTVISDYGDGVFYCQQCLPGDYVSSNWKYCETGCLAPNCLQCYQFYNLQCYTCKSGYYVNSTNYACVACQAADCDICTGLKCLACKTGYQLNPRGDKCTKVECLPTFVFDGFACLCPKSTYMTPGLCLPCNQANCKQCSDVACFSCDEKFYLEQSQCLSCLRNCKYCTNNQSCLQCITGHFYQNSTSRCLSLQSQGRAYLVLDDAYVQCPSGCLNCNSSGICLKCTVGYALSGSGCIPCQSNCQNCLSSSTTKCISCYEGYYWEQSSYQCKKCTDLNCLNCILSVNLCSSCIDGYYVISNTCTMCPQKCFKCNKDGLCSECVSGFTLINSTCIPCIGDCHACNASNLTECIVVCKQNQIKVDQTCLACPINCQKCVDAQTCIECVQNYVLKEDNTCKKRCQQGCFLCDQKNSTKCLSCFTGYFLSNSNSCIPDIVCMEDNSCQVCPVLWTLVDSACTLCNVDANCLQCAQGNPQQCIECVNGYYIQNQSCIKCTQGCKTCQKADKCKSCTDGFYMKAGQTLGLCFKCDENCRTCVKSPTQCTSCNETLILNSKNKCQSKQKVVSQIKVDCPVDQYASVAHKVTQEIQNNLGEDFKDRVSCKSYRQGSTIAVIQVTVPPGMTPEQVLITYTGAVSTAVSLGGIPLISVQKTELIIPSKSGKINQTNDSKATIIIIAVVIPSLVIILVITGYILRKRIGSVNNAIHNNSEEIIKEKQTQPIRVKSKLKPIPEQSPTKNFQKTGFTTQGYKTVSFNDTTNLNHNSHQYLGDTFQISRAQAVHPIQQNNVESLFNQTSFKKLNQDSKILPQNINDLSQIKNIQGNQAHSLNQNEQIQFEDETLRQMNQVANQEQKKNELKLKTTKQPFRQIIKKQIHDFESEESQF